MRPRATISSRCSKRPTATDRPAKSQATNDTILTIIRPYADEIRPRHPHQLTGHSLLRSRASKAAKQ
jgi:hypothetical protein